MKTTTTTRQPKTVALSTYIQSMVIAVLVTAVISFIASYFVTINIHSDARQSVIADLQALPKEQAQPSSK